MKKQIRKTKAFLTRVEMIPFPVWKKFYFIFMATIGALTSIGALIYFLLYLLGAIQ